MLGHIFFGIFSTAANKRWRTARDSVSMQLKQDFLIESLELSTAVVASGAQMSLSLEVVFCLSLRYTCIILIHFQSEDIFIKLILRHHSNKNHSVQINLSCRKDFSTGRKWINRVVLWCSLSCMAECLVSGCSLKGIRGKAGVFGEVRASASQTK